MDLSQQTYNLNLPADGGGVGEVLDLAARFAQSSEREAGSEHVLPQALLEWQDLLDERHLPSAAGIGSANEALLSPASILMDVSGTQPSALHIGSDVQAAQDLLAGQDAAGEYPVEVLELCTKSTSIREPFEFEMDSEAEGHSSYRGIVLPFAEDGENVDRVLCVFDLDGQAQTLAETETTDIAPLELDSEFEGEELLLEQEFEPVEMPNLASEEEEDTEPFLLISTQEQGSERPTATRDASAYDFVPLPKPTTDLAIASPPLGLLDYLSAARDLAQVATSSETRSRRALYRAISCAYDFALAAGQEPETLADMIARAGLKVQERAPMAPLVKLVFGADYDKTRLTEYAAALAYAYRMGLKRGSFGDYLLATPGGLKEVVKIEREWRRSATAKPLLPRSGPRERLARKLRRLPSRSFAEMAPEGDEFVLVLARRDDRNGISMVGEVPRDIALLERAARKLIDQQR